MFRLFHEISELISAGALTWGFARDKLSSDVDFLFRVLARGEWDACRGIRGATTISVNEREEILTATRQLLALLIRRNGLEPKDVASAVFTTTPDIDAEFPALAARQLGWLDVPLLCSHEMTVPGGLERCVRVLIHWNTEKQQDEIEHVYVRDAKHLRPDLSKLPPVDWDELEDWITEHMGSAGE